MDYDNVRILPFDVGHILKLRLRHFHMHAAYLLQDQASLCKQGLHD